MLNMQNLVEILKTERPQVQRTCVYIEGAIIQIWKLKEKRSTDNLQKYWIDRRHCRKTALFKRSPSYLSWWPEWCRNKPSSTEAPRPYGHNRQGGETWASRKAPATWTHIRKQQKQFDQPPAKHWAYVSTAAFNYCVANHTIFEMLLKDSKSCKTGARNAEIGSAERQNAEGQGNSAADDKLIKLISLQNQKMFSSAISSELAESCRTGNTCLLSGEGSHEGVFMEELQSKSHRDDTETRARDSTSEALKQ